MNSSSLFTLEQIVSSTAMYQSSFVKWIKPFQQNHMNKMHIGISTWLPFLDCGTIYMQRKQNLYRNSTEPDKSSTAVGALWHREQLRDGSGSSEMSCLAILGFF